MKKTIILVLLVPFFFTACKQKDTRDPLIFLKGDNPMNATLGAWWEDPGVDVDDNVDGTSLINKVTVTHNIEFTVPAQNGSGFTKTVGAYSVNYEVQDNAGNVATATRIVNVKNSAEKYATSYEIKVEAGNNSIVPDTQVTYPPITLTYDNRINNRIFFPKLGFKAGLRVYGDIVGSDTIDIPDQKTPFWENSVRYLYGVKGITNQSVILDTIDPWIVLKYQIDKYVKDPVLGTVYWPLGTDTLWRLVKNDVVTDTYIRY